MNVIKGGTFSLRDYSTIKKLILNTLNPDAQEEFSDAEKVELKALYHRLGRNEK